MAPFQEDKYAKYTTQQWKKLRTLKVCAVVAVFVFVLLISGSFDIYFADKFQDKQTAMEMVDSVSLWALEKGKGHKHWAFGLKYIANSKKPVEARKELVECPSKGQTHHDGDWPFCESYHILGHIPADDCIIYSFGINREWQYDDAWAKRGCSIYSFDPTTHLRAVHENHATKHDLLNIHFEYMGLSGGSLDSSSGSFRGLSHQPQSNDFLGGELKTLDQIFMLKGHQDRIIEALKVDCEGCEWGALKYLARLDNGGCATLANVKELQLEFHFGHFEGTIPPTADTVLEVFDYLLGRCGFKIWYLFTKGHLRWRGDTERGRHKLFEPEQSTMRDEVMNLGLHPNMENINVAMIGKPLQKQLGDSIE
mmetsp:Transcript_26670/g.32327  ORF Transcript_26670/g.32327 Transcript_26670/m.32327 type:complete len:366 (+) Transcript_26670:167-1264(+)|eukprot:CAMPEP_0204837154 /NCGR_PEP_ID=MMETSP1346-20131115/27263_1 /ASSEMBLY_ACC=CAM_ASM_000771 /TAXON_ID=215587 /ORGANISM="Aplanochytrium stocchinoi, Strain GSBS06" /LENGTH=365 /DNA_ID=CAMNT_0051972443 /DNA_START=67 /DNA_END=1164 /DNA_ORIENTATION=-